MNPHYRTQRLFFIIAILVAIGLLYLVFHHIFSQQQNPNQSPETQYKNGIVTLVLKSNNTHTYLVDGKLNQHPVTFLVDTGASSVAISSHLAKTLKLKHGPAIQLGTANGVVTGYSTRINHIQIGGIRLQNIAAVINPGMHDNLVLLGNSALKHLKITYHNQRIVLQQGTQ